MHVLQLLLQIGAILLVGRGLGLLFRRIGQPAVVAEILAGILLGPSLLGLLAPGLMAALFPADSMPVLGMISQLGLVFFMFLIGLEFDVDLLRHQGRASVPISASGIVLPFSLGALLSLPLYPRLAPAGVPPATFALFMGIAMSITAFPVLARILSERRLIRTRIGTLALASAAVGDVVAWCLLAAVVAVASASGVATVLETVALAAVYVLVMWRLIRPMLARIGPRGDTPLSSDLIAGVFLLLLASASATEWIGIHALFGAFMFGVVVPRQNGLASSLIEKLEDLVTLVLLPMFFATSGLRTQIGLLSGTASWATAGLIILVATLGKFGGTALAARMTGLDRRTSAAVGILMNTRGLMELVVLNIGLDLKVISPELFAMMVVMALVTTVATSPLLERIFPAAEMLAAEADQSAKRARTPGLLLCVADPATTPAMVQLAAAWTRRSRASVWALHLTPIQRISEAMHASETLEPEDVAPLGAVEEAATSANVPVRLISLPSAEPAADIVRFAAVEQASVIILGAHRSPLVDGETLGGITGAVLAEAPCDVVVLVARGAGPFVRVGVLGDDPSVRRVAEHLRAEAGAELVHGAQTSVDLVVASAGHAAVEVPEEGPSWLFVRGAG